MRNLSATLLVFASVLTGCHSYYEVTGRVHVLPSALASAKIPRAVCLSPAGAGYALGPDGSRRASALIICRGADSPVDLPFYFSWYTMNPVRKYRVHAWLVDAPEAASDCALSRDAVVTTLMSEVLHDRCEDMPSGAPYIVPFAAPTAEPVPSSVLMTNMQGPSDGDGRAGQEIVLR